MKIRFANYLYVITVIYLNKQKEQAKGRFELSLACSFISYS